MDGILPLWKEKGMTSHDCVFKLRKILGTKKVGHTGTLDPSVEGVLPICIGQATKVAEYVTDSGKEYVAVVSIGTATETEDADGAIIATDLSPKRVTRSEIEQVLTQLTGEITQIPPMYSAVKVNGRKLYEYARKGIEVDRPKRKVLIHEIELLDPVAMYEGDEIAFRIRISCGKGTYIRTLAVQIGELLGYPAHMAALVRTASGGYVKKDCRTLDEVRKLREDGEIDTILRPLEDALTDFSSTEISDDLYEKVKNGQVLPEHLLLQNGNLLVFMRDGKAIAVYRKHPTKIGLMKPEKMFPLNSQGGTRVDIYKLDYPGNFSIENATCYSLAIGFFDGLHKGHQAVIGEAKRKAQELGIRSAVMTFDPHPSHLFGDGKNKIGYVTQYPEKVRLLRTMGIDALFIVKFDWKLASLSPEQFTESFIKGLNIKHVTAGFDFTFGSKGAGTMERMAELSQDAFGTTVIGQVQDGGEKISSTRIRQLLSDGNVEETESLLGRPFRTDGIVVHGEKRGRLLGFPTANVAPEEDTILPANGVYAVRFTTDNVIHGGVCSVGVKPTFHKPGDIPPVVEVHVFDFDGDLYGKNVSVDWIGRIRGELKFSSAEALIEEMEKDKKYAKEMLASHR